MACRPRDRRKARRKPGDGPSGESRPFQFGLGEMLAWVALLCAWWGLCQCLGMNVCGLLLTTAWLFTVAVVRAGVGELAALAVSVALGLIAEVLVVFVPAVTPNSGYYAPFASLAWTWEVLFLWLVIAWLLGGKAWLAVRVAFELVDRAEKFMHAKGHG